MDGEASTHAINHLIDLLIIILMLSAVQLWPGEGSLFGRRLNSPLKLASEFVSAITYE